MRGLVKCFHKAKTDDVYLLSYKVSHNRFIYLDACHLHTDMAEHNFRSWQLYGWKDLSVWSTFWYTVCLWTHEKNRRKKIPHRVQGEKIFFKQRWKCVRYIFRLLYFQGPLHCLLYSNLFPAGRSFQPYITCQTLFQFILWQKIVQRLSGEAY